MRWLFCISLKILHFYNLNSTKYSDLAYSIEFIFKGDPYFSVVTLSVLHILFLEKWFNTKIVTSSEWKSRCLDSLRKQHSEIANRILVEVCDTSVLFPLSRKMSGHSKLLKCWYSGGKCHLSVFSFPSRESLPQPKHMPLE